MYRRARPVLSAGHALEAVCSPEDRISGRPILQASIQETLRQLVFFLEHVELVFLAEFLEPGLVRLYLFIRRVWEVEWGGVPRARHDEAGESGVAVAEVAGNFVFCDQGVLG